MNNRKLYLRNEVPKFKFIVVLLLFSAMVSLLFLSTLPDQNVAFANELHAGCKAVYLIDADGGTEMYSHNSESRLPIASMVKIMTTLLAFEAVERGDLDLNEIIVVSDVASGMGGSQVFLDEGKEYRAGELIKSIVVASANDSCVAIAEHLEGSVDVFVKTMNRRASELGMKNTNFVNCTGLPAPEGYSCAKDVSIMFRKLITHPIYFEYAGIWLEEFAHPDGRTTSMTNTNKLIRQYSGCDGGKTGFTNEAKFCLSATAQRNDMRVIAVVIGADSSKDRFASVSRLFNYAFSNYNSVVIKSKEENVENSIRVLNGRDKHIKIGFKDNIRALVKTGNKNEYELKYDLPSSIKAPIKNGSNVGKAYLTKNGEVVAEYPVVALMDVDRASYGDKIKEICRGW